MGKHRGQDSFEMQLDCEALTYAARQVTTTQGAQYSG